MTERKERPEPRPAEEERMEAAGEPSKRHGDALLEGNGARHGIVPEGPRKEESLRGEEDR